MATKGILLLNLGTPEEPTAKGLRKFYKYFFLIPSSSTSIPSGAGCYVI